MIRLACFVALAAVGAGSAHSESMKVPVDRWDFYGSLGGAIEGREGVEVEIGAKFKPASWVEFGISPANLVFYENEDDQYERQSIGNGQSRCRNLNNGQFADDEMCAPATDWRGVVTGEFNLGDKFSVGGGYLISDDGSAFGSLRYNFNSNFALQGRAGSDYGAISVVLTF